MQNCSRVTIGKSNVDPNVIQAISLDLPRTYPNNRILASEEGQKILAHILYRLAETFPDIGYCQVKLLGNNFFHINPI